MEEKKEVEISISLGTLFWLLVFGNLVCFYLHSIAASLRILAGR